MKPLKETNYGVAQDFSTPKRDYIYNMLNIYFRLGFHTKKVSSCETPKPETFTATYGLHMMAPFICKSPSDLKLPNECARKK